MSVEEAAELLGIGRAHAYRAAKRGDLPVIRIGTRIRVVREGIERMLAEGAKVPTRAIGEGAAVSNG